MSSDTLLPMCPVYTTKEGWQPPRLTGWFSLLDFYRRYRLYLDQRAVMHLLYRDDRARRFMLAKDPRINVVDRPPQIAVGDIDRHLDDMVEIASGRLQNTLDISDRLLGLGLDAALDNLAGLRGRSAAVRRRK